MWASAVLALWIVCLGRDRTLRWLTGCHPFTHCTVRTCKNVSDLLGHFPTLVLWLCYHLCWYSPWGVPSSNSVGGYAPTVLQNSWNQTRSYSSSSQPWLFPLVSLGRAAAPFFLLSALAVSFDKAVTTLLPGFHRAVWVDWFLISSSRNSVTKLVL